MALDDFKSMNESQLEDVISQATALLEERKSARKQEAIEAAREALAAAGLTFRDVAKEVMVKGIKRVRKAAAAQAQKFVHPETGKTWVAGRGRRPNWVAEQMSQEPQDSETSAGRK